MLTQRPINPSPSMQDEQSTNTWDETFAHLSRVAEESVEAVREQLQSESSRPDGTMPTESGQTDPDEMHDFEPSHEDLKNGAIESLMENGLASTREEAGQMFEEAF